MTTKASGAEDPPFQVPNFDAAVKEYDDLPAPLIHPSCDVESPEAYALLRALRPDVTVCLGGPVYPQAFIDCSPLTLNFHSGIAPLYNGSASIQFAFAHGHPHLCGGTLMVMNAGVDNGRMLGHYLPAIHPGDTPDTLFRKTVYGAVVTYHRLLESLTAESRRLPAIPQPKPLFYTRGVELGWHHEIMIARNCRRGLAAQFARAEAVVEYWRADKPLAAQALYQETLNSLLWGVPGRKAP